MRRRRHGQRHDHRTHRLSSRSRARGFAAAAAAVGGITALVLLAVVRLPSGTGAGSLAVRASVAFGIGLGLILLVRRILGAMSAPPPAAPPPVDARTTDVVYECAVCGTRVRLEVAATGKPPRHCGEDMEPTLST